MTFARRRNAVRSAWIRQFHEPAVAGPTLVCFPHAGGSASAHFPLSAEVSAGAEVLIVQYPARQDRLAEPAVEDLRQLADEALRALEPWQDRPLALFGHSMGSIVAYEVALRLERLGRAPLGLIASGHAAPSVPPHRTVHGLDDDQFTRHVAELAGTPPELLTDKNVLALALPSLRADFTAIETYLDRDGVPLGCPISGYCGKQDDSVSPEGFGKWADYTTGRWTPRLFDGGHFYLQSQEPEVARAVLQDLADFTAAAPTARP